MDTSGIFEKAGTVMDEIAKDPKYLGGTVSAPDWIKKVLEDIMRFINMVWDEIEKIINKIYEFLGKLFPGLTFSNVTTDGVKTVGIIVGSVAAAAVIAVITVIIVKKVRNSAKNAKADEGVAAEAAGFGKNYMAPMNLAREYREKGDFRMSLRYIFIAVLVRFASDEVILLHKGRTNRMYFAEAYGKAPKAADTAAPVFDAFSECWYGGKPANDAEIGLLMDVFSRIDAEVSEFAKNKKHNSEETVEATAS